MSIKPDQALKIYLQSPEDTQRRVLSRFLSNVNKVSLIYWQWVGTIHSAGYGIFFVNGASVRAHRFAYTAFVGEIPDGLHVCHMDDTPDNVFPGNLWLGTIADNSRDRARKGRGKHSVLPGESNGRAKLTRSDVVNIRARYAVGGITQKALAAEFGISQTQAGDIIRGRRWASFTSAKKL